MPLPRGLLHVAISIIFHSMILSVKATVRKAEVYGCKLVQVLSQDREEQINLADFPQSMWHQIIVFLLVT
jgi:hypothetical protein